MIDFNVAALIAVRLREPQLQSTLRLARTLAPPALNNKSALWPNQNYGAPSRRLTRLPNAFSKKLENFEAAVALNFAYHNFVKTHKAIRMTPAMAARVE